eukprot:4061741-Pyramimonas_sp.AAC.1
MLSTSLDRKHPLWRFALIPNFQGSKVRSKCYYQRSDEAHTPQVNRAPKPLFELILTTTGLTRITAASSPAPVQIFAALSSTRDERSA